jgi:hypothetical protein
VGGELSTRDRTIDAARATAIAGVVAGHWLVTGLVAGPDGVTTASPLTTMPFLAPATWFLQTLGLLFFAGGYAAARRPRALSPRDTRHPHHTIPHDPDHTTRHDHHHTGNPEPADHGDSHHPARLGHHAPPQRTARLSFRAPWRLTTWRSPRPPSPPTARTGIARLVRPALVLIAGWALILLTGAALGMPTATLQTITRLVVSPLWFLLPYLCLRAATGPLRRIVHRVGAAAVLPLIATVAAGDLGFLPWPIVLPAAWAIPWLLGMILAGKDEKHVLIANGHQSPAGGLWAVGTWTGAALAFGGAAALAALVLLAGYPASAVGVPGAGRSNLDPPSLAAVALAVTQIGVFLLLRRPLARLLQHDRAWRPVGALTRAAVPVYLLHQSALLAVAGAAGLVNPAMPGLLTAPDSPQWAWQRLAWLPVLGVVLALLARGRHHDGPDYLKPRLRGTLFDGSRARTTSGGDRCAR